MRTSSLLLSLSVLLSCGVPAPGEEGAQGAQGPAGAQGAAGAAGRDGRDGRDAVTAGSRLQPLYLVGSDGSRSVSGWYRDMQTGKVCGLVLISGDIANGDPVFVCAAGGMAPAPGEVGKLVRFTMQP